MAQPVAGVVLRRELLRLSRRRQTWILRALYSALLMGVGIAMLQDYTLRYQDPSELARVGRNLFQWYVGLQLFAVAVLAPLLVASGVQEEKESRTLDLLALTGIPAGRILLDQISSRLVALLAVVLAGAPFLAMLNTFGGFSTSEAINAVVGAMLLGMVLGSFAGHCSLVTRGGPLLPLALCLPYALFVLWLPPLFIELGHREGALAASPLTAAFVDHGWMPAVVPLWIGVIASGWGLSVPVFRIMAAGDEADDEFGLLSPDIWAIERFKKRTWMIAMLGALLVVGIIGLMPFRYPPHWLIFVLGWATAAVGTVAMHRIALIAVVWAAQRLQSLSLASFSLAGRPRTTPRRILGPPVAWREVATRAAGAARLLPIPVVLFWLAGAGFWWLVEGYDEPEINFIGASWAALFGFGISFLVATSTLLDERRRRTLGLLFLTHQSPLGVAAQKMVAPVVFALPLFALGAVMYGLADPPYYSHAEGHGHELGRDNLLVGVPGVAVAAWMLWQVAGAANIGLLSANIAATLQQARAAWATALVATLVYMGWPLMVLIGLETIGLRSVARDLDDVITVWWPMVERWGLICDQGGVAPWMLLSIGAQLVVMPLLLGNLSYRLRVLG